MTEKVWVVVSTEYVFGEPSTPDIDVFATKGQANTFATARKRLQGETWECVVTEKAVK
jgi:hypothetical protein